MSGGLEAGEIGAGLSRRSRREGIETLSARQLEIARLVYDGMTNREIAATLVLSEKTVETHLSAVFAKLGVSSRTAVSLLIARDGIER